MRHAFDAFEIGYDLIFKEQVRAGRLRDEVRRHRRAEPGPHREGPRVRPPARRHAPGVQEVGPVQEPRDVRGVRRRDGRDGPRGRARDARGSSRPAASSSRWAPRASSPPEFGLARRVDAGRPSAQFYAPGPIVEAEITQPSHPDLLRLSVEERARALCRRAAAVDPGAGGRPRQADADALPRHRCGCPERVDEGRGRNAEPPGDCGSASRAGAAS